MGGCCVSTIPHVHIDLSDDVSTIDREAEVYNEVKELLDRKDFVFQAIEEYKGCQKLARAAMSKPSEETELAAFEGLLIAVESIALFHQFAKDLEKVFPKLLTKLSEVVKIQDKLCHLDELPGLTKQLATIFDFALSFDRIRMLRPNLSNDFSYYRRLLPKFTKHPNIKVKDDEASGMALFTGEHIPMTSCLAKAGAKAQELLVISDGTEGKIGYVLSTMANSCMMLLQDSRDTNQFIARAMTGAVVVFDHVDPLGAFHKRTPIAIRQIIRIVKQDFSTSMLNAIRYSTRNFRDAPDSIQAMFD